jgi:mono/diheme cytochrome c family protein
MRRVAIAVLALGIGGGIFLIVDPQANVLRANPDDEKQVALGTKAYAQHCAACHGANLEGEANWRRRKPNGRMPAPPHDATGHSWHHPDEHLFEVTKNGVKPPLAPPGYESDMPGFADKLGDPEIWAIIAFVKSRWPREIRERQPRFQRQRGQP